MLFVVLWLWGCVLMLDFRYGLFWFLWYLAVLVCLDMACGLGFVFACTYFDFTSDLWLGCDSG